MISALVTGFASSFSLILAIGAQNSFVLRQGLTKTHVFAVCLFCAVADALLICLGVAGFGSIVTFAPWLPKTMAILGAIFLVVYGLLRFLAAYRGDYSLELSGQSASLGKSLAVLAYLTFLNPHVYLDTMALLGAISTQFLGADKIAFAVAASAASFVFFFSLGYGARYLAPIMKNTRSWVVLDILIGIVMWLIALGLITSISHHA